MYFGLYGGTYFGSYFGPTGEPVTLREVPNLAGLTPDQATTLLEASSLLLFVITAYDDTIARGFLISQSPSAGSLVAEGSQVAGVFSLGQRTVYNPGYWAAKRQRSETTV